MLKVLQTFILKLFYNHFMTLEEIRWEVAIFKKDIQYIEMKLRYQQSFKFNNIFKWIKIQFAWKITIWPQWLLNSYLHLLYSFFWLRLIIISQQYVPNNLHGTYILIYTKNVVSFFPHLCMCAYMCYTILWELI